MDGSEELGTIQDLICDTKEEAQKRVEEIQDEYQDYGLDYVLVPTSIHEYKGPRRTYTIAELL